MSWISAAIFILGLAIIAGIYLERNSTISEVRFSGHYFTDNAELEASFSSPVGLHPDSVRFMEVIDTVNMLPWIRQSGVRVDARGRMIIDVEERTPVARLVDSGRHMLVDNQGVILPVIPGKSVDVPLLHGFSASSAGDSLKGEEFRHVQAFLNAVKKSDLGWITLSEVGYHPSEGVVALTHENGVKVIFGHGDYEQKIGYWQAFYREVVREKGIRNFTAVDIRYQNQIVTR